MRYIILVFQKFIGTRISEIRVLNSSITGPALLSSIACNEKSSITGPALLSSISSPGMNF